MANFLTSAFSSATLRSRFTPDVTVSLVSPDQPPQGNPLGRVLLNIAQPEVILNGPGGVGIPISPYGSPSSNWFIPLVVGAIVVGAGVFLVAHTILNKLKGK